MHIDRVGVLGIVSAAAACSAIVYDLLCIGSALKFVRERRARLANGAKRAVPTPPVSVLKPLRGTDPEMYESFRSHCLLDYPAYEILFAVHDPSDPALALIERLKVEFPERDIRELVFPSALGANLKVSNLAQMTPLTNYEYLVVNDSDIRVGRDYLRRVMAPFSDEQVGMVTCLYRGVAQSTIASKLEVLGISTDFCAGVLVAQALEGQLRFGLGSTLAFRKRDLERVGGFQGLVDHLADDYELGARISETGKRVQIADTVVDTLLPRYSWREFLRHQLRWARGIRHCRPWGYLGLAATYGVPWAALAVALAGGAWWAWVLLAVTLAARLSMAFVVGESVLGDGQVRYLWWLIPIRDCIGLTLWAAAYAGRTVHWRGDQFVLKNGKLTRAAT
jgi:ceramide glucosyltransferase